MQPKQRDEEKRTKEWRLVMMISTVVIVLVIAIMTITARLENPLKGEWISEEKGYSLEIQDEVVEVGVTIRNVPVNVMLEYTIDKKAKTITFKSNVKAYQDAAEYAKGAVTAGEIDEYLTEFTAAFDYSLEDETLILTEREYGEQFIFTKVISMALHE